MFMQKAPGVAFSPDDKYLATNVVKEVTVWDAYVITGPPWPRAIAILVWLAVLHCIRTFSGHKSGVSRCSFSADGSRILSAADDGPKLWDVSSGLDVSPLSEPSEKVAASAFSPDGLWLVTASDQKTLKTWDVVTGRRLAVFSAGEKVADDCAVSPDNRRILYGTFGVLGLIDSSTGAPIADFHLPVNFWVMRCAFSADGMRVIAVDNHASELRLWNAGSAEELAALHTDVEYVSWLNTLNTGLRLDQEGWGFSRDGTLAVAVFYGALKVWSISNGVELARFVRFRKRSGSGTHDIPTTVVSRPGPSRPKQRASLLAMTMGRYGCGRQQRAFATMVGHHFRHLLVVDCTGRPLRKVRGKQGRFSRLFGHCTPTRYFPRPSGHT
jgi:WD40 repeat protein